MCTLQCKQSTSMLSGTTVPPYTCFGIAAYYCDRDWMACSTLMDRYKLVVAGYAVETVSSS